MPPVVVRLLPFLRWFPMSRDALRADILAGITVALILVPQSMAYAQLAGLPVVYGLYASFVPVIIASLWGSSSQLHTGPVAMLSLMSAAALIPYAIPGSVDFIELSIMLAVMVGVLRLLLGLFRLGAIVNLLSSPVIIGFTNAAALIIGLSQLSKVIGVPFPRTESYLADLWRVIEQIPNLHWPTFLFALATWIFISGLRRIRPSLPGILMAVLLATLFSALLSYEDKTRVGIEQIADKQTLETIDEYVATQKRIAEITNDVSGLSQSARDLEKQGGLQGIEEAAVMMAQVAVLKHELAVLKRDNTTRRIRLHNMTLEGALDQNGTRKIFIRESLPEAYTSDGRIWHFADVEDKQIVLSSGGLVVGEIPKGLPEMQVPIVHMDLLWALFPAALVMALIGFMEATSISKAIASSTGERVDTSKELIGQGLANIAGSFFGSYTVSGSFSRSAVAAKAGAKSGLFAIISAVVVMLVLLYFTPFLYHLPQAVLAVIVMMAVFSLIRIKPLIQAWHIDRVSAGIGVITFIATLLMAPSIANGILLGVSLSILHYLIRTMKPRAEIVARKQDGTLGGIRAHHLQPISDQFVPVRFDGSLNFINVAYFEDMILEAQNRFPNAKAILVVGSSINEIDASGEEKVREIAHRLQSVGIRLIFSSLKHQVMRVFETSGLVNLLGRESFFSDKQSALNYLIEKYDGGFRSTLDGTSYIVSAPQRISPHLL